MTEGLLRAFIPSLPLASLAALLLVRLASRVAPRLGFIDRPRADRFHTRPVPLLGGPACILAAIVGAIGGWIVLGHRFESVPFLPGYAAAALFGTAGLLVLGLVDDLGAIPPLQKGVAVGGILAIAILLWCPGGDLRGAAAWGAVWAGGMLLVNAWNYLDHADGVFATAAAAASATLAVASWRAGDPITAVVLAGSCGALIGYLYWNAPPARIFLGDSGSLAFGFLVFLAGAAIVDRGIPSIRPAVLASNAIPIVDISLVTIVRVRQGRNPFHGGREHSGHRLTRRFGSRWALIIIACASLLFSAGATFSGSGRIGLSFAAIAAGMLLLLACLGWIPPPE